MAADNDIPRVSPNPIELHVEGTRIQGHCRCRAYRVDRASWDRTGLSSVVWRQMKVVADRYWWVAGRHLDSQGCNTLTKVATCPVEILLSNVTPSSCLAGPSARLLLALRRGFHPALEAPFAALPFLGPLHEVRRASAAVRLAVCLLRAAGTACRRHARSLPLSGGASATASLLLGVTSILCYGVHGGRDARPSGWN